MEKKRLGFRHIGAVVLSDILATTPSVPNAATGAHEGQRCPGVWWSASSRPVEDIRKIVSGRSWTSPDGASRYWKPNGELYTRDGQNLGIGTWTVKKDLLAGLAICNKIN